jgi:hypothetical protein
MTQSTERALGAIKAQHAMLRGMMDRCEAFADELDAGRCGPLQLTREVARLRLAFAEHNRFEEQLLRPLLLGSVAADVMDRQVAEHVDAHRAMRVGLQSDETAMLRDVIEAMRAHLIAEEQYLFATTTFRAPAFAD